MELTDADTYPEKIKQLLEEIKWAKDKQTELQDKVKHEAVQACRQKEQVRNLEQTKRELESELRTKLHKMVNT